jgi:signal transduction histidine kinase
MTSVTLSVSPTDVAMLRAEQAHSPEGVLIVDAAGRITSHNPRFAAMWRIPRRVLRARSDEKAIRYVLRQLVDPQGFVARVQYLYSHPEERSVEELALRDGRVFERHSAPVRDARGAYLGRVWYFRDVSERRLAERLAREAEHLRLHRDFVANVSHELRTPLAAIEGFTETLLTGGLEDARHRRPFLTTILRQSRRLRGLVDSLLEVSHLETRAGEAAPERVELGGFVREAISGMRPLLRRKGITVGLRAAPGLEVMIDETHLARVAGNLLDNAIKYSPRGSRVRVEVRKAGRRAELSVSDRGVGIAPEDLPHVFERLRRSGTARRHGIAGHGIGLSLAKELVERAGGTISATSVEGRGSIFLVRLPLAGRSAAAR